MGAELFELALPEAANIVNGIKNSKSAAKNLGRQTLRKQLEGCGEQKRSNPTKIFKQNSRSCREIFNNRAK